jgi:hypothetical protein
MSEYFVVKLPFAMSSLELRELEGMVRSAWWGSRATVHHLQPSDLAQFAADETEELSPTEAQAIEGERAKGAPVSPVEWPLPEGGHRIRKWKKISDVLE